MSVAIAIKYRSLIPARHFPMQSLRISAILTILKSKNHAAWILDVMYALIILESCHFA